MKKYFHFSLILILILIVALSGCRGGKNPPHVSTITTIAGTGEHGYSGDGGPATSAQLSYPFEVAVDSAGNIYIADSGNHCIRKVDSSGNITTIAGTGERGYSGDGGPATSAQLASPYGVAVDSGGNIYIAEAGNHRIRKVDSSGNITTIAGTGENGYSGEGGPAISAQLSYPYRVVVDSARNIYIADSGNHRIRKVDSTGKITTIAGTGVCGYSGDGGPATSAQLNHPSGVAVDSNGNVYIADEYNNCIRKVDSTGKITTIAGTGVGGYSGDCGPATSAQLSYPYGAFVDSVGNIYIADSNNHCVRKVDSTGKITTIAGTGKYGYSGDGGPAISAQLNRPYAIAVDSVGNIYIADSHNQRIRKVK